MSKWKEKYNKYVQFSSIGRTRRSKNNVTDIRHIKKLTKHKAVAALWSYINSDRTGYAIHDYPSVAIFESIIPQFGSYDLRLVIEVYNDNTQHDPEKQIPTTTQQQRDFLKSINYNILRLHESEVSLRNINKTLQNKIYPLCDQLAHKYGIAKSIYGKHPKPTKGYGPR